MLYRIFLTLCLALVPLNGIQAAHPYDSVAEIAVKKGTRFNGGSATLIAVSETQGLLLTCQHVVLTKDREVWIRFRGELRCKGKVYSLAPNGLDAALVICPRPEGIQPVPVVALDPAVGRTIVNAGYPGDDHVLRWQSGTTTSESDTTLRYNVRPIPGMSGGPTFDEYGNLVAVVQFYNRKGGGSTGGRALRAYLADFIKKNAKVAWGGPANPSETKFELVAEGSMEDAPEEFSDWAAWAWDEFRTGPVKNFLEYLKDPMQNTLDKWPVYRVTVPGPPVEITTPRINISVTPDQTKITRPPRRNRKYHRRRFRSLRRR